MSTSMVYVLPASYAQQRLWLAYQMDKDSSAYNIVKAISMKGDLNEKALERSINEVINRHETLRTSFDEEGGVPRQIIRPRAELEIKVEQLEGSTPEQMRRQAEEAASREAGRGFDLSQWPLMRVRLLRLGEQEHILLIVMHHIISDGWSLGVLMREMGTLYDSYSRGEQCRMEELEIQYADYAVWQREWLESGEMERQMSYWREQMKGAPAVLEIATDYVRHAEQSYSGRSVPMVIGRETTRKLREISRREGVTMFMSLLTAFDVLMTRYSNQKEVVVGTPMANRSRAEVEGLIGFFVNTLVMRVAVDGKESYRELLKKVKEVALGAYANQDVPFEKLIEELQPERDLSHSPLFQVMFALQNQPADELKMRDLKLEELPSEYETSKFDLTLALTEENERIKGAIRYRTDLFKEETIKRMARHFVRLVESIVDDPDSSVNRLDMVSPAEKHQMLVEWNDTALNRRTDLLVHQLFEAEAAKNPRALAVASASGVLNYGELDVQANRLSHLLREKGISPEKIVGVCMDRSIDLIICELAVLKAGGAYLPIDPSYPQDRISYMLSSSQAPILLTVQALSDRLKGLAPEVISVDSIKSELAGKSSASLRTRVAPENLAYIIYTSGSTGRPKGVGIPHASLMNLLNWHEQIYQTTRSDRATMLAGVSFDASVLEVWPYLVAGASLHIPDEQVRSSIGRLIEWIKEFSITFSFMPTPVAELALAQAWPDEMSLKWLLTGGEKLHWPGGVRYPFQLTNNYGPTENTVITTSALITCGARTSSMPPIGRPVSNAKLYVLDSSLRPVPIGAKGELYIGGHSLARDYLGDPALTAERFIPDPYAEQDGERLYGTGDVVRYLGDGNLEFWGRSDEQIKIRGYRIEPGEIEAALLDYPGVNMAAVTAYDPPEGQKQLVAYVVGRQPSGLNSDSLKDHLRKRLAPYMVPAKFVFLESLPLTSNGKLDKRRLPKPEADTRDMSDEIFLSLFEEKLAKLWSEVLRVSRICRHDNFFEIGGHSLAAMQLVAKVRQLFDVDLNIRNVFEEPTVTGLAALIEKKSTEGRDKPIEKIRRANERKAATNLEL